MEGTLTRGTHQEDRGRPRPEGNGFLIEEARGADPSAPRNQRGGGRAGQYAPYDVDARLPDHTQIKGFWYKMNRVTS